MPLSQAYTNACPLFSRARSLGAKSGEAFSVEPAKADRIMFWVSVGAGVFVALFAFGGGFG